MARFANPIAFARRPSISQSDFCETAPREFLVALPGSDAKTSKIGKSLRNLAERGLRRVLLNVQDDFSDLLPVTTRLFSDADVQLCVVHMQLNPQTSLKNLIPPKFQQLWRTIKASWNSETGALAFDHLCDRFQADSPRRRSVENFGATVKLPSGLIVVSLVNSNLSPWRSLLISASGCGTDRNVPLMGRPVR
jgi:hypothetical protein